MTITKNAQTVLEKRYLLKDESGAVIETPAQMFDRVAAEIARVEKPYMSGYELGQLERRYSEAMLSGAFEPNSPLLANAGKPGMQYSACYVLPIEDDMRSIFTTMGDAAIIHKQGGGTGFSFSRLRPAGDRVLSTMGVASGPVSFMEAYNAATGTIAQGGMRRGANMGVLRVDHPDVLQFVAAKADTSKITNFNISVAATDEFMSAVKADGVYALRNPRTGLVYVAPSAITHPQTGEELVGAGDYAWLPARMVFDAIIANAWATGEPGLLFIDAANRANPVPHLGDYEATNPCGEQWLLPYDVCNLGSVNVGYFVDPVEKWFDWVAFGETIKLATRFLDAVIDANTYPLPQIDDLARRIRRIGLGVMGWADALIRLGIPYNSTKAILFADQVMGFLNTESEKESERLADIKGVFPEWERSVWGPDETCARDQDGDRIKPMRRLRNCNITTVAPTGTISMIANCSSGIEPLFAVAFMRNQAGALMADVNADFEAEARAGGWHSAELMERIASSGHIHHAEVPQEIQDVYRTAHDIEPFWHVAMQGAFQANCHSSISKTINFSNAATVEEVAAAFLQAYERGCKGITVYRDGCRANQVLSTGATSSTSAPSAAPSAPAADPVSLEGNAPSASQNGVQELEPLVLRGRIRPTPITLPAELEAHAHRMQTPAGTLHAFITEHDGLPVELYTVIGRAGSDVTAFTEGLGRLASLLLRCGVDAGLIADQLEGIGGSRSIGFGPNRIASVPDALGRILRGYEGRSWEPGGNHTMSVDIDVSGALKQLKTEEKLEIAQALAFPAYPVMPVEAAVFSQTAALEAGADFTAAIAGKATGQSCPECNNLTLYKDSGCTKCIACGYSAC
jgi:ribonucleoside-diphosphate reductase alpha chain